MIKFPISVFLDTNVFIKSKYNLSSNGSLDLLIKYVNDDKISLFTSQIAINEIIAHAKLDAIETVRLLNKAKKDSKKILSSSIVADTELSSIYKKLDSLPIIDRISKRLNKYFEDAKMVVLENDGVLIDKVLEDYFLEKPPFEKSLAKKCEFPDAFMIYQIKNSFSYSNPITVITGDKGFREGLKNAPGVKCLENLKDLFDIINKSDKWYPIIEKYIDSKAFFDEITETIKEEVMDGEIDVDGNDYDRKGWVEGYDYDESYPIEFNIYDIKLISVDEISDDGYIHITLEMDAEAEVDCYFDDYEDAIWDSEDKEYFGIQRGNAIEKYFF